jgi:hypothetical protein
MNKICLCQYPYLHSRGALTRRHSILNDIQNLRLETPVTFPISHTLPAFEMLSQMIYSNSPRIHHDATETAPRSDFRRSYLPRIHRPVLKLDIVDKLQMLAEMVFSIKCPFFNRALRAA